MILYDNNDTFLFLVLNCHVIKPYVISLEKRACKKRELFYPQDFFSINIRATKRLQSDREEKLLRQNFAIHDILMVS